jgi:tellurite resistance protein
MQVTPAQKSLAAGIAILYIVLAGVFVGFAYWWVEPDTGDKYKEFGALVGIGLTADAALMGILASFLTVSAQIRATKDLAASNEAILKRVEDHKETILTNLEQRKKELTEEIEKLKGNITLQNDFLNKTLDAKSAAYNKLFVAVAMAYGELQSLAKGEFDADKVKAAEDLLREGDALAANLDEEDREIVTRILQTAYDIRDSVEQLKSRGTQLKSDRESIWNKYAPSLGSDIRALRDRSPFYNKKFSR